MAGRSTSPTPAVWPRAPTPSWITQAPGRQLRQPGHGHHARWFLVHPRRHRQRNHAGRRGCSRRYRSGDYNNNGVVDAADYVVWRNAGPTDVLPNDPTSGTVDASDYDTFRANSGETRGGPDPASATMPRARADQPRAARSVCSRLGRRPWRAISKASQLETVAGGASCRLRPFYWNIPSPSFPQRTVVSTHAGIQSAIMSVIPTQVGIQAAAILVLRTKPANPRSSA